MVIKEVLIDIVKRKLLSLLKYYKSNRDQYKTIKFSTIMGGIFDKILKYESRRIKYMINFR